MRFLVFTLLANQVSKKIVPKTARKLSNIKSYFPLISYLSSQPKKSQEAGHYQW